MKKQIHLNESELNKLIKESVKKVLKEISTDTAIAAHKKAQSEIDNMEFDWNDLDTVDKYYKRQRQIDKFADYAQENNADYYPYGLIGWYSDDSDGVFDKSEVVYGDTKDEVSDEYGIYALTREGKEVYEQWRDDVSCGYDLCNGRMKGLAARIGGRERDLWKYLTTNKHLSKKIRQ